MDPYSKERLAERAKGLLSNRGSMVPLMLNHPCEVNIDAKILQAWIRGVEYLVFG